MFSQKQSLGNEKRNFSSPILFTSGPRWGDWDGEELLAPQFYHPGHTTTKARLCLPQKLDYPVLNRLCPCPLVLSSAGFSAEEAGPWGAGSGWVTARHAALWEGKAGSSSQKQSVAPKNRWWASFSLATTIPFILTVSWVPCAGFPAQTLLCPIQGWHQAGFFRISVENQEEN